MSDLPRWCHVDVPITALPTLLVYGEWAPTKFDQKGRWFFDAPADYEQLRVGKIIAPNISDDVDRCNWKVLTDLLAKLDPEGEEWRIERFGHWATPFDILLVRPGTQAEEICRRAEHHIDDFHPILDEDEYEPDEGDGEGEVEEDEDPDAEFDKQYSIAYEAGTCIRCGDDYPKEDASDRPNICAYCMHAVSKD